jgi:carboxyl-terminal processing protease
MMLRFIPFLLGIQGLDSSHTIQLRGHNPRRAQENTLGADIGDGMWGTLGYGWVVKVESGAVSILEQTALSCIPSTGLLPFVNAIEKDGDNLILKVAATIGDYVAVPIAPDDPGACNSNDGLTPLVGEADYTRDPLFDFDVLGASFQENYAFFELRGIDWEASLVEARAYLTSDSTDDQLLGAFKSVLGPLDDGHVYVLSSNFVYASKPFQVIEMLKEEFQQQQDQRMDGDFGAYQSAQLELWTQNLNGYLREPVQADAENIFFWGESVSSNVGYMRLQSFSPQDVGAFFQTVDSAFEELSDTDTIIFDIRINPGGFGPVGLQIASYFVSEPVHVMNKYAIDGDGFTETTEVYIESGDAAYRYKGDVVLIISGSTVSAAETFTIIMKQLPQVTIVGRNTSGATSDILRRQLPNGWGFSISPEVYSDVPDGTVYEMTGVPPHILIAETELLSLADREAGVDSWLELALDTATMTDNEPQSDDSADSSSIEVFSLARLSTIVVVSFLLSTLL